ncbi:MAG: L-glutamate gamma-semialdehyde dehydrogenase, partial [Myxococcota bacterium]|nr:L-glutamate gamma-semialdehyde dehydrogenase [Myxococcota bacterium]
ADVRRAIAAALEARSSWAATDLATRARIFRRAAELLSGPRRQRLNAATLLGQSKTPYQAEIDSACELVDFLRFNAHYAERLAEEPLISPEGVNNSLDLRPLDGFVYAVTPFNFTAIAGNLPSVPALLGNTVVWKPSPSALLSAHHVYELFQEAGLPPGVINLLPGDAELVTREVLSHHDFAALHFTGSSAVFDQLYRRVGENVAGYRAYPRLVGETGGKDFIVAHSSAELDALAVAIVRGGFEYQGQKCSAASRVYVPASLWKALEQKLVEMVAQIRVGDPADFTNFMGAVINQSAFERIGRYLEMAEKDPACRIVTGGGQSAEDGWFVEPTIVLVTDPGHALMTEEIFGPVVAVYVYADDRFSEILGEIDAATPYALTGAVFARDAAALAKADRKLRFAAGNFYVNDKPTGAVVGQQPFGGSRRSGTNDKAGAAFNLLRFVSPRVRKVTLEPARDFRYPFLLPD